MSAYFICFWVIKIQLVLKYYIDLQLFNAENTYFMVNSTVNDQLNLKH